MKILREFLEEECDAYFVNIKERAIKVNVINIMMGVVFLTLTYIPYSPEQVPIGTHYSSKKKHYNYRIAYVNHTQVCALNL